MRAAKEWPGALLSQQQPGQMNSAILLGN